MTIFSSFLARQNEWEKYLEENDCKQGDLSDPMYFDFISAAQFATVTQLMGEGKLIFEERTGAEGTVSVVSRDASLQNDEVLPAAFFRIAGDKMYAGLMANFTGENFYTQPPQPTAAGAPDSDVIAGLSQLYKKMVELGYALEVKVSAESAMPAQQYLQEAGAVKSFAAKYGASGAVVDVETLAATKGTRVSLTLKAPATLWGRQWLGMQEYLHTDHGGCSRRPVFCCLDTVSRLMLQGTTPCSRPLCPAEGLSDLGSAGCADLMIAMAYLRKCGRAATVHSKVDANSFMREFILL